MRERPARGREGGSAFSGPPLTRHRRARRARAPLLVHIPAHMVAAARGDERERHAPASVQTVDARPTYPPRLRLLLSVEPPARERESVVREGSPREMGGGERQTMRDSTAGGTSVGPKTPSLTCAATSNRARGSYFTYAPGASVGGLALRLPPPVVGPSAAVLSRVMLRWHGAVGTDGARRGDSGDSLVVWWWW